MARTGQQQAEQANKTSTAEQGQAFSTGQSAVGQFNQNVAALDAGKPVAANPWANPTYQANENRLQSDALNANTNSGKEAIQNLNTRTGGLNTSADRSAISSLALQKARLGNQLGAQRAANEYNQNVQYQTQMAEMPLQVASAESPYFSTATGGVNSADNNLTQFGLQSQGFWNNLANLGIKAGFGAASGGLTGAASAVNTKG